jgi:Zn-dependent peptidase ImmA (M78 family)
MDDIKTKKYRDATSGEISKDRVLLGNNYAHLDGDGNLRAITLQSEQPQQASASEITNSRLLLEDPYAHLDEDAPNGYSALPNSIVKIEKKKEHYSINEIEQRAINLQKLMWKNRQKIWPNIASPKAISILDPIVAFSLIGYDCDTEQNLGEFIVDGKFIEAAGIIDITAKKARISRQFKPNIQRFTAAHELGHAMLHTGTGLHRDKALEGITKSRDHKEFEANKFAIFFLMPSKLVRPTFKSHFLTEEFAINEATAFALGFNNSIELKRKYKTHRDLSRMLAAATQFNGRHFNSLATQFNVSIETMAIRLEELNLVSI